MPKVANAVRSRDSRVCPRRECENATFIFGADAHQLGHSQEIMCVFELVLREAQIMAIQKSVNGHWAIESLRYVLGPLFESIAAGRVRANYVQNLLNLRR